MDEIFSTEGSDRASGPPGRCNSAALSPNRQGDLGCSFALIAAVARARGSTFPTALATLVPPAFAQFRRGHPDVALTVVDDHLQRLIPRLEAGELDLALIYDHESLPDIAARDLERKPLLDDVFQAVLPTGHRLNRRRPLELSDLSGEPWIGGAPTSAWHRIVGHACRLAGFEPQVGFASDDPVAVQALVAAGLGVSVIPGLAVAHPLPGIEVQRLGSDAPVRYISAARPRDGYHGPAVTAMLDSLRASAQAFASSVGRDDQN